MDLQNILDRAGATTMIGEHACTGRHQVEKQEVPRAKKHTAYLMVEDVTDTQPFYSSGGVLGVLY